MFPITSILPQVKNAHTFFFPDPPFSGDFGVAVAPTLGAPLGGTRRSDDGAASFMDFLAANANKSVFHS